MKISYLYNDDTIVAPATPPGEGGIGIVRLSGPGAEDMLSRFFSPRCFADRLESHRLYYGFIHDAKGQAVDEVMAVIMRKPRSYTRQDVVEIHCHGGSLILRRIMDLFLDAGVRLALPGEFTLRAFLNGRIDLTQAEAVIDLIRSRSELAGKVALGQLSGNLWKRIADFSQRIADLLSLVEAYIDFPEEELDSEDAQKVGHSAGIIIAEIDSLIDTFDSGRVLRDGLNLLLFGRPNTGKSSLMNALLGEARSIVTDIPGTTRDTVEETLVLKGLPLRVVDTAGIRITDDPVEREGVRRARAKVDSADLVLLVIDGSVALNDDDLLAIDLCRHKDILVVLNKKDMGTVPLPGCLEPFDHVPVSALDGEGLDLLCGTIIDRFAAGGG